LYPATAELALEIGHFGKAFFFCWVGSCEINYSLIAWAENKRAINCFPDKVGCVLAI
jgi:hypothetical protein